MKVVYFGTGEYAVKPLQAILSSRHEVVAVVSQPDKAIGRSNKIVPTAVKKLAIDNNIQVFQYEKIRKDDISELLNIDADIYVTCSYGQILGENVLFAKKYGVINLHGSLLPKYRGASPVQFALLNNDKVTGVTVLKSGVGMDDGPVIYKEEIEICEDDNAITLFEKLSNLSAKVIVPTLDLIESGKAEYIEQNHNDATHCKMLKAEMGDLDFSTTKNEIIGKIKGLAMWPNAHITIDGVYFKLYNAREYTCNLKVDDFKNGEVVVASNKQGLVLKCSDGFVGITEVLPINAKKMSAKSYLNGKQINIGSIAEWIKN